MAYPTDPRNPADAEASAFANARLTAEEAERLAATFRPSWELDQAPFSGSGNMSDADLRALRGDGAQAADVRAAVQALNGTHAPAPATILLQEEPQSSVIIDPAVVVPEPARVVPPMQTRTLVLPGHTDPRRGIPVAAQTATTLVRPRARAVSIDASELEFAKRSKTVLWAGLGAAAAIVVGVGIWLASSSGDKQAPLPPLPKAQATVESRIPPPKPPEAIVVQPPPPAPAPVAPTATPVAAAVQATPPPAPAAPPTPPPRLVVPPAPRQPTWTPPAARPAPKPKAGATIVRDVPF